MKSQQDPDMVEAFTSVNNKLAAARHWPKDHILNTECPSTVQHFLDEKGVTRQKKTSKYQTIMTVATLGASCPIQLWIRIIPQIQDTLNMLWILQ